MGVLILAVAFMAIAWDNDTNNMAPYQYINNTADLLDKAKQTSAFEQKIQFIYEAITTYGQGPNLDKLQMLASFDTNQKIDYTFPAIKIEIINEYLSHRNMVHALKVAVSEIAFFIVALVAVFLNWDTLEDGKKHIVWGLTITLLLLILALI